MPCGLHVVVLARSASQHSDFVAVGALGNAAFSAAVQPVIA